MKKRILAVLLCLCMVLTMLPVSDPGRCGRPVEQHARAKRNLA